MKSIDGPETLSSEKPRPNRNEAIQIEAKRDRNKRSLFQWQREPLYVSTQGNGRSDREIDER